MSAWGPKNSMETTSGSIDVDLIYMIYAIL